MLKPLTENHILTMLSVYDESEGTTRAVSRRDVLERLNLRKAAEKHKGRITRGTLSILIQQLDSHNYLRREGKSYISAVHTIVGFRTAELRRFTQRFCAGAVPNLIEPAIRVIGHHQLQRHLHEHQPPAG